MFHEFLRTHDLAALLLPPERRRAFPDGNDRARWDGLPPDVKRQALDWGREALKGYPPLTATQFLAFSRTGDRKRFETPYFARRELLMGAALAACVDPDNAGFLDAAVDGLWAICEETSWIISAHNDPTGARPPGEKPLPDVDEPYIDLFAAQTAVAAATVTCLLRERLDAVSPLISCRVMRELERRVFTPFFTRNDFWWMGFGERNLNNWTPWIVSNVADAMLMLMDDQARLATGLARAMGMMDRWLASMPDDGGLDEGPGYWNMAGGSLLDFLESLSLATGGRANFYDEPLIRSIGAFPLASHIQGPYFWNFADCDAMPMLDGERLYRFGLRTRNEALMELGARLDAERRDIRPLNTPQMNRVLTRLLEPPAPPGTATEPPGHVALPKLQVFAWRSGGLYAAIKGGHNDESHNHNDIGAFLIFADGEPQVVDAGNMTYTARTFGPERYTLWNTRSENHNVPLIGGMEQRAGRRYEARDVCADENGARMELSAAYPEEAGIARFTRELTVNGNRIALSDTIALKEAGPVTWVFMLRHRPRLERGAVTAGKLRLRYDMSLNASVAELPVTDACMARNFPGSLWRLTLSADKAAAHTAVFWFEMEKGS